MTKSKKILLSVISSLLILLVSSIYCFCQIFEGYKNEKTIDYRINNEYQWLLVESILKENLDKAHQQASDVASKIESNIKEAYPNLDVLGRDFDNGKIPDEVYDILRDNIKGKYLNINNDNNDMWIFMKWGVATDLSLSTGRPEGTVRSWENELKFHYNKSLADDAVTKLLLASDDLILWEMYPSSIPNHQKITTGNMKSLKEVFLTEGYEGLKNYEFLVPVFITDTGDIFGTPDINNTGELLSNHKLIITQGFNLYDQIMYSHRDIVSKDTSTRESIEKNYESRTASLLIIAILLSAMTIIVIFMLSIVYNYECQK